MRRIQVLQNMRAAAFWSEDRFICEGVPPAELAIPLEHMRGVFALVLVVVDDGD